MSGRTHSERLALACEIVNEGKRPVPSAFPNKGTPKALMRAANAGHVSDGRLLFTNEDKDRLRHWLEDHGVDPAKGVLTDPNANRIALAGHQANEKANRVSISRSRRFVALAPAGTHGARLNGIDLCAPVGGFVVLQADENDSLCTDWVMTVENMEAFLALIEWPPEMLPSGIGVMVLRTSRAFPYGQGWAQKQARTNAIIHIHAPDLDPSGLSHVGEMGADCAWLPTLGALSSERAIPRPELFSNQGGFEHAWRERLVVRAPGLEPWVRWVCDQQSALTQESMLAADLEFSLVRCAHDE